MRLEGIYHVTAITGDAPAEAILTPLPDPRAGWPATSSAAR